jgi:hypothetical protein
MLRVEAFNCSTACSSARRTRRRHTAATSIFGQVTSQANQPRLMQLAFG